MRPILLTLLCLLAWPIAAQVVTYPTAISNLSLTASKTTYYRFTETSGTSIADSGGASHTGTLSGTSTLNQATLLTSDANPSILLDGGHVVSGNVMPAPTTGLTLSGLISINSFGGGSRNQLVFLGTNTASGVFEITLLTGANTFNYSFVATDGSSVGFNSPTVAAGVTGRIYHVVVTHDFATKTVKLYQDGILVLTGTYSQTPRTSANQPFQVANDNVHSYIDETLVAIDRVLTDSEVYGLFQAARGVNSTASVIYVGPAGNYRATGVTGDPIDIFTALRSGYANPCNQTYNLKAGDYTSSPTVGLPVIAHGTASCRLTVQNNPGEHVRILQPYNASTGTFALQPLSLAQYVDYKGNLFADATNGLQGFEITNTGLDRYSPSLATAIPLDECNARGASLISWDAAHSTMQNLMLHDGGLGADVSQASTDTSFTGIIAWHNGTNNGGTNITGMALYVQNASTSDIQTTSNGIFFRNFNYNFQAYGKTGPIKGVRLVDTILSDSGAPARGSVVVGSPGGPCPANFGASDAFLGAQTNVGDGNVVDSCDLYHPAGIHGTAMNLGYIGPDNQDYQALNNHIWGASTGIAFVKTQTGTMTGNTIYNRKSTDNIHSGVDITPVTGFPLSGFTLDHNTYYADPNTSGAILAAGGAGYTFANWQGTLGYDTVGSTFTNAAPVGVFVRVHPSPIVSGMASVSVFNPQLATTASVNLSTAGLVDGQLFQIVNVQGASVSGRAGTIALAGTYNAASPTVTVPMNDATCVQPYTDGVGVVTVLTSEPEFGLFLLIPGDANPSAPAEPTGLTATWAFSSQGAVGNITLAWTNPTSGAAVIVDKSSDGTSWTNVTTTSADAVGYTVTGLATSDLWYFRVRASKTGLQSANTNPVTQYATKVYCYGVTCSL